jgi:hypothetical protein
VSDMVLMNSLAGDLDDSGPYWDAATRYLAARMSEVSEDAACATWEYGVEFRIWRLGSGVGIGEEGLYDADACRRLVELGQELGCWWVWHWGSGGPEGGGPRRVTMDEWTAIFLADRAATPAPAAR